MKNNILTNTFGWLFIGLLVCFGISYVTTFNETISTMVFSLFGSGTPLIYAIAEIVIALVLIFALRKLNPLLAKILYIFYTALTGLSFNGLFMQYTSSSITYVFLATAIIFGIFAIIGKTTNIDLSKWSIYLLVALIAIIILEIINIFLANNTLNMFTCIATILIFSAYVAYDIQKVIDPMFLGDIDNKAIYCAFELFLDFINIFIRLLELFGNSRD